MRLLCSVCHETQNVDGFAMQQRRKAGLEYRCSCGADIIKTGTAPKVGRNDNQRRSKRQEEGVARRTGSRRQKASGSLSGAKADVRDKDKLRGECKLTRAKSYSLKLEELIKVEGEAHGGEHPVMFIEFQHRPPFKRYAVIPEWLYVALVAEDE